MSATEPSSNDIPPASPPQPEVQGSATVITKGNIDTIYEAKAKILNDAMHRISFGRYHKALFVIAGFGWMADNLWPQVTAIILPPVVNELHPPRIVYLSLAQNLGLAVGAAGWGIGSDIIGRRWAFNLTLLIAGAFGLAASASPNFAAVALFAALWSVGVGGNLPVDSAVFLEFIPGTHQYLLTVISVWWAFGQILSSAVAWPLMANYACEGPEECIRPNNMGWRYFVLRESSPLSFTVEILTPYRRMGGFTLAMFLMQFLVFDLHESPKFLMGRGKDAQAVESILAVARYNNVESTLSIEHLMKVGADARDANEVPDAQYTTISTAIGRNLGKFKFDHIRALFATKELAFSTSLVIALWALVGLAFPLYSSFLPYFLASCGAEAGDSSTSITFRNYLIIAICGVPGSLLAGLAVDLPLLGRKGTMSVATILTGIFLFVGTTARTTNSLLGWNCGYSVTSSTMYGILYSYTPEIFPTTDRGTGNGLAGTANRIFGIIAPIIAMYADLSTSVPIYISGALFLAAGLLMLALPYEPMGKTSL